MNLGQLTSLVRCVNCGNAIEIYASQKSVKCNICNISMDLKMGEFTKEESNLYEESIYKIFKQTNQSGFNKK